MSDRPPPTAAASTEVLPFSVLLDEAVRWTRHHFVPAALPLAIPLAVVNAVLGPLQTWWSLNPRIATSLGFGATCGLLLLALATTALTGVAYAAITVAAVDAASGRPPSWRRALGFVVRPAALGTLVLAAILVGVSYMCCLVPVLLVGPLLSLTVPAMVTEGRRGLSAIGRSTELVRYNPHRRFVANPLTKAFLLVLVTFVLYMAVSLAVMLPLQLGQAWSLLREVGTAAEGGGVSPWAVALQVPVNLVGTFLGVAVWLYASFGFALLFFDLRRRKEGTDLEQAIERIEAERRPVPPAAATTPEESP